MRGKLSLNILWASAGLITIFAALPSDLAFADQLSWNGSTSTDWTDSSNWTNSGGSAHAPQTGDLVTVDGATTADIYNNLSHPVPAIVSLTVGDSADGSLDIENSLTSNTARIGFGADGTVTISGSLGNWTNGDLTVGVTGIGTLDVTAAARYVGIGSTTIATADGSSGSISVSGGGSFFQTQGPFIIGDHGTGSFEVVTGARAQSDDEVTLGRNPGSTGSANIAGGGSAWTIDGDLTVGENGTGSVTVATGAIMSSATAVIGEGATSDGSSVSVSGTGSAFDTSGQLTVGGSGEASLDIFSGATATSGSSVIGRNADGTVTVAGLGSLWTSGDLTVGSDIGGDGTLDISAAGKVESKAATLGAASGSTGAVNIDGSSSLWTIDSALTVGDLGTGTVKVTNAGTVQSDGTVLGADTGGTGNVLVTGSGSAWTDTGTFTIGSAGTGNLQVTLGAALTAGDIVIADGAGSTGTATITGDGSVVSSSGTITVGAAGNGTLTLAGGGTVSADSIDIATDAGATGTLNIGAALGSTAAGAATLDVDAIHFGAGSGTLVFNFGGPTYTLTAAIDGDGAIDIANGNVIFAGNSSAFTGVTTLYGGSLTITGILGGVLDIMGGTLDGSGTTGSLSFASSATASPGSSGTIGTLTVDGNVAFADGSTYEADVGASGSDLIHATGTATLSGGNVLAVGEGSGFEALRTYRILTADGGVTGTFKGVTSTYAFLNPTLDYDADDVTLTLERNDVSFEEIGRTHNQQAAAEGVESLGGSGTLYTSLLTLTADDARSAFSQLAGDMHASISATSFDDSRFVRGIGIDRLRAAFGGVGAATGTVYILGAPTPGKSGALAYGATDAASNTPAARATAAILVDPETAQAVVWGQGYGSWGRNGGDSNASGMTASTGGVVVGIDAPFRDTTWRFGVLGGYSHDNYDQSGSTSSADGDGYDIGLYGGNRWGPLSLRFGALYGRQNISTRRTVAYSGFAETLSADYAADTAQAFAELGYALKAGPVELEPFANLAYVHLHNAGFTENGGAAALDSEANNAGITYTTLGLHAATDASFGAIAVTARGTLGWRHAFGDRQTASTFSFAGGSDFTTYGDVIAADSLVAEAGIDFAASALSTIGLTYSGQYGDHSLSQTVKANFTVRF